MAAPTQPGWKQDTKPETGPETAADKGGGTPEGDKTE
jgi:hypothetical protein